MEVVNQKFLKEKGFALILVLSLTTAIMTIVAELLFQTEIIVRSNESLENQHRATSTALNGLQLAQYLLKIDLLLAQALKQAAGQVPDETIQSLLGGQKIFQLLNDIPLGREAIDQLAALDGGKILSALDPTLLEFLQTVDGYFVMKIEDISGKFNLNLAAIPSKREPVLNGLIRMFSLQDDARFLLNLDGLSPREMAENIINYIDSDDSIGSDGGAHESSVYQRTPLRKPKNAPLRSLEELRRIPPFEQDEIFAVFAPYLTVFPYPESRITNGMPLMNINIMDSTTLTALSTPPGQNPAQEELDRLEESQPQIKEMRDLAEFLPKSRADEITKNIHSELLAFKSHTYSVVIKSYVRTIIRQIHAVYTDNKEDPMNPFRLEWIEYR